MIRFVVVAVIVVLVVGDLLFNSAIGLEQWQRKKKRSLEIDKKKPRQTEENATHLKPPSYTLLKAHHFLHIVRILLCSRYCMPFVLLPLSSFAPPTKKKTTTEEAKKITREKLKYSLNRFVQQQQQEQKKRYETHRMRARTHTRCDVNLVYDRTRTR